MYNQTDKILFELVHEYKEKLKRKPFAPGINFYEAFQLCLNKLISGESDNVFDILKDVHSNGMHSEDQNIKEKIDGHFEFNLEEAKFAVEQLSQEPWEPEEDINVQDISNLASLFRSVGEGLDVTEYFKIKLAIRKLTTNYPIDSIRFWGKVFGTKHDYYVIECRIGDPGAFLPSEEKADHLDTQEQAEDDTKQDPQLPKPKWKPPPDVTAEDVGEGVNSHVYFVSNHACGPYTPLPICQPKHIAISRLISSFFTGDLISKVSFWSSFPGTEAHYLRAQIARISSGTLLAPKGFFQILQEKQKDAEDEIVPTECEENEDYVPLEVETMRLSDWVHSRPYILPQGRVTWINPKDIEGSELEDSESDTDPSSKEPVDELPKREKGVSILTPISADLAVGGHEPWRVKSLRDESHLLVSSLLWPGAHTAAKNGTFENIYVGWGLKATKPRDFPCRLQQIQCEILQEPEEMADPTPEQEKANEVIEDEEVVETFEEDDEEDVYDEGGENEGE